MIAKHSRIKFNFTFIILATLVSLCPACAQSNGGNSQSQLLSNTTPNQSKDTTQLAQNNSTDVSTIKKFAENYQPKSGRTVIPEPPEPSEKVLQAISNLVKNGSTEHEKYIVLIFLRIDRFNIEHFKQSYELGRVNPLTKEFYRIIKADYGSDVEFRSSGLASEYVSRNEELLKYQPIQKEMDLLNKVVDKQLKEYERQNH